MEIEGRGDWTIIEELQEDMVIKLRQNEHKGKQDELSQHRYGKLFRWLKSEVDELEESLRHGTDREVQLECADVANIVAIISHISKMGKERQRYDEHVRSFRMD